MAGSDHLPQSWSPRLVLWLLFASLCLLWASFVAVQLVRISQLRQIPQSARQANWQRLSDEFYSLMGQRLEDVSAAIRAKHLDREIRIVTNPKLYRSGDRLYYYTEYPLGKVWGIGHGVDPGDQFILIPAPDAGLVHFLRFSKNRLVTWGGDGLGDECFVPFWFPTEEFRAFIARVAVFAWIGLLLCFLVLRAHRDAAIELLTAVGVVSLLSWILTPLNWGATNTSAFCYYKTEYSQWGILLAFATGGIRIARWAWSKSQQPPCGCRTCAYDLTGNTSGICPECGTPIVENSETIRSER